MRIIFMGTGEIAIPTLQWLISCHETHRKHEVVAVYTQPDKPVGRRHLLTSPEVKVLAEAHGIPVRQPETLRGNEEAVREFSAFKPDLAVVMAYGQILPLKIIQTPSICCVNLHASLLPRYRGASPIQAAIREGDAETGITLMHVVAKLDAGDMILKEAIPIRQNETGGSLHDRLAALGPYVIERGLKLIELESFPAERQDESLVTYSGKLLREDGEIDWTNNATAIERMIRAYEPWPGTTTEIVLGGEKRKLKVHPTTVVTAGSGSPPGTVLESGSRLVVNCGGGEALVLAGDLQLEGRRRLNAGEFLRGVEIPPGTILG